MVIIQLLFFASRDVHVQRFSLQSYLRLAMDLSILLFGLLISMLPRSSHPPKDREVLDPYQFDDYLLSLITKFTIGIYRNYTYIYIIVFE